MPVPVSHAALIARINRRLIHDDKRLYKSRSEMARADLGEWYIVNVNRNLVVAKDVDPEEFAREIGVLTPYERVRD